MCRSLPATQIGGVDWGQKTPQELAVESRTERELSAGPVTLSRSGICLVDSLLRPDVQCSKTRHSRYGCMEGLICFWPRSQHERSASRPARQSMPACARDLVVMVTKTMQVDGIGKGVPCT